MLAEEVQNYAVDTIHAALKHNNLTPACYRMICTLSDDDEDGLHRLMAHDLAHCVATRANTNEEWQIFQEENPLFVEFAAEDAKYMQFLMEPIRRFGYGKLGTSKILVCKWHTHVDTKYCFQASSKESHLTT